MYGKDSWILKVVHRLYTKGKGVTKLTSIEEYVEHAIVGTSPLYPE